MEYLTFSYYKFEDRKNLSKNVTCIVSRRVSVNTFAFCDCESHRFTLLYSTLRNYICKLSRIKVRQILENRAEDASGFRRLFVML